MNIRVHLFLLGFLILALSLGCQKTYNVPPLTTQSAAPTATPPCYGLSWGSSPATCTSGIFWGQSLVWNYDITGVYQYGASLDLTVNCAPETTAGVTLTGPGVTLPLAYSNLVTISGTVYAAYQSVTVSGNLTSGDVYTLTSVTSLGTASSSVTLPEPITLTKYPTYDLAMWNGYSCGLNLFFISTSNGNCFVTGPGYEAVSPMTITSWSSGCVGFPSLVGVQLYSSNTNIVGGSGVFTISNGSLVTYP